MPTMTLKRAWERSIILVKQVLEVRMKSKIFILRGGSSHVCGTATDKGESTANRLLTLIFLVHYNAIPAFKIGSI